MWATHKAHRFERRPSGEFGQVHHSCAQENERTITSLELNNDSALLCRYFAYYPLLDTAQCWSASTAAVIRQPWKHLWPRRLDADLLYQWQLPQNAGRTRLPTPFCAPNVRLSRTGLLKKSFWTIRMSRANFSTGFSSPFAFIWISQTFSAYCLHTTVSRQRDTCNQSAGAGRCRMSIPPRN